MRFAPQHIVSLARIVLGIYVLVELRNVGRSETVFVAIALACALDAYDGILARQRRDESLAGRLIDNVCDAVFLAFAFSGFAMVAVWSDPVVGSATRYWEHANWLPAIGLALSFGTYLVRWAVVTYVGRPFVRSPRGHHAGIANYVLALVGGVAVWPGVEITPWLLEPAFLTVFLFNASAAGENLMLIALEMSRKRR